MWLKYDNIGIDSLYPQYQWFDDNHNYLKYSNAYAKKVSSKGCRFSRSLINFKWSERRLWTPTYVILLSIPLTSFFATFLFAFRRSCLFRRTFFRCASTFLNFLLECCMNSCFIFKVDFRVCSYCFSNLTSKAKSFGSEVAGLEI